MLYVGDTLYAHSPIIFPPEGNLTHWFQSIDLLISVCISHTTPTQTSPTSTSTLTQTSIQTPRLNAGHSSSLQPALSILSAAKSFLKDVVSGLEPIQDQITIDGVLYAIYTQSQSQSQSQSRSHSVLRPSGKGNYVDDDAPGSFGEDSPGDDDDNDDDTPQTQIGQFSLRCPLKLIEDARNSFQITK